MRAKAAGSRQRLSYWVLGGIRISDHCAILGIFQNTDFPNTAWVLLKQLFQKGFTQALQAVIANSMTITWPEATAELTQFKIFDFPIRVMHIHTNRKRDTMPMLLAQWHSLGDISVNDVPLILGQCGAVD